MSSSSSPANATALALLESENEELRREHALTEEALRVSRNDVARLHEQLADLQARHVADGDHLAHCRAVEVAAHASTTAALRHEITALTTRCEMAEAAQQWYLRQVDVERHRVADLERQLAVSLAATREDEEKEEEEGEKKKKMEKMEEEEEEEEGVDLHHPGLGEEGGVMSSQEPRTPTTTPGPKTRPCTLLPPPTTTTTTEKEEEEKKKKGEVLASSSSPASSDVHGGGFEPRSVEPGSTGSTGSTGSGSVSGATPIAKALVRFQELHHRNATLKVQYSTVHPTIIRHPPNPHNPYPYPYPYPHPYPYPYPTHITYIT